MATVSPHLEFAPPATPGMLRALLLALMAHGVLVAVLTLGVQWKHAPAPVTVMAELWSAVPQEAAAPAPLSPAEPPLPPLPPVPQPKPEPQPAPQPEQPKPAPQPDPAIAIAKEKEKAKLLKEKQLREEKLELEKKRERLEKEKALKDKADKLKADKDKTEKDKADKALKDKAAKREQQEAKALEELRQQNITRMANLAGSGSTSGNGAPASSGTAAQSSAPTASYMGRIAARIKPNIVYIDTIVGNPKTEVEVRMAPDGTIVSSRIVKASGVKSWDEAALKAIDKTGVLPKDETGRVPPLLIIVISPQDLLGR